MSALRDVLAVVGAMTVLSFAIVVGFCVVAWRRGREAEQYRDEMQGTA